MTFLEEGNTKEIYASLNRVWPDSSTWYDYVHQCIIRFVQASLENWLSKDSIYLNAGSGGSVYELLGNCIHVDIAENLIHSLPHHYVASVESLPFQNDTFDAAICVGSVLNYCDAVKTIRELSRTLKPRGYLVLEYERSHTGELLGNREYGKNVTIQKYEYLGHVHTLYLYSERLVTQLLRENRMEIRATKRFHCLSAVVNRIVGQEEFSGRFARFDPLMRPFSYFTAHNVIVLCEKRS